MCADDSELVSIKLLLVILQRSEGSMCIRRTAVQHCTLLFGLAVNFLSTVVVQEMSGSIYWNRGTSTPLCLERLLLAIY